MNTDKKLLAAGILVLSMGLGSLLWLGIRTNAFDLENLFASHHKEAGLPTETGQNTSEVGDAKMPAQEEPSKEGSGKVDIVIPVANNPAVEMSPTSSTPVSPTQEESSDGVISKAEVTLPESAFAWTKKGYVPREGDTIRVKIRDGLVYELILHYFDRGLTSVGNSIGMSLDVKDVPGGSATIVFCEERISVTIVDPVAARVFNISYDPTKTTYIIREVDSSKRKEIQSDFPLQPS